LLANRGCRRTSGLLAQAFANGALVLEIDVPALCLASGVFESEREDGVALVDGVLAVSLAGVESVVDLVESRGGRELVYCLLLARRPCNADRIGVSYM
jgi:hypothetical protein